MSTLNQFSTRAARVPQSKPVDSRQVPNSAGGYTFTLAPLDVLRRFLILGTDSGSYYASAGDLTTKNGEVIVALANGDEDTAHAALHLVTQVSTQGLAPKNDQALFALAILAASKHAAVRSEALAALPLVARTGTHLFQFVGFLKQHRGWGRGARNAIANWYVGNSAHAVAQQVLKYRNRAGYTHRDVVRLAHPKPTTPEHQALLSYIVSGNVAESAPDIVSVFERLQDPKTTKGQALTLIRENSVTWEMLPEHLSGDRDAWATLVQKGMPITALIRNLPRLTRYGVFESQALVAAVVQRITDEDVLRAGRVHPMTVLLAQTTYGSGFSVRGSSSWSPVRRIVDALDDAFYKAFRNVEPTGKRTLLALDVSGSMVSTIANTHLSARTASAAMAMITAKAEENWEVVGFTSGNLSSHGWNRRAALTPLDISPRRRLDDNVRAISGLPFGGTDCSLPMTWAAKESKEFDTFVVYTDNETWAGAVHPHIALQQYRQQSGIDARLAVVGMTATESTIADPTDKGMLDFVGFDASAPSLISAFSKGEI